METSKRRQIPMTNACAYFSFKGLRKKKNFMLFVVFVSTSVTLRNYFRHAENYFRHCQKLHTSQQRQRPIQYAHTHDLTMAAAGRAFGPDRAVPGIRYRPSWDVTIAGPPRCLVWCWLVTVPTEPFITFTSSTSLFLSKWAKCQPGNTQNGRTVLQITNLMANSEVRFPIQVS